MKILYINDAVAIYGGLERVLTEKINWLVEHAGYEVCLLTTNQGTHPLSFPLHPDVHFCDLDIRFHQQYHYAGWKRIIYILRLHYRFRKRLKMKLQELKPNIIICVRLDILWDIIWVKGTIPCIFESHSSKLCALWDVEGGLRKLQVWFLLRAIKRVQMVVALTNGDAEEWRKLNTKVQVIPNVVHLNDMNHTSACNSKSAIFVGRFSKQKDIGTLLHIWYFVNQRHPDWCLHIYAGYGGQKEEILSMINQMEAKVLVHEETNQMFYEYIKASFLLMTSLYEPFGLVLPEAMSCGLPVVAFDCPYGPADIISDGKDGFLIKNRVVSEFVNKVNLLIEDEELRRKMGKVGILSSQKFSASVIMPRWTQLFNEISNYYL